MRRMRVTSEMSFFCAQRNIIELIECITLFLRDVVVLILFKVSY